MNQPMKAKIGPKRFLLFQGGQFYPCGGWEDFASSYDTLLEAMSAAGEMDYYEWYHVVDLEIGAKVAGTL